MTANIVQLPKISTVVPAGLTAVVARLHGTLGLISEAEEAIAAIVEKVKALKHEIVILAMSAGDDLIAIKEEVGYGNFGPWVEKNFPRTARTATKYMELANGRDIIEAKIGTGSVLSITTALKLLRGPKDKKDPYSAESLAKLPPEERARVRANLGITITSGDVPAAVKDELVQAKVNVAVSVERQAAAGDSTAAEQCLAKVRTKLTTGASAMRQVEDALEAIDHYYETKNALPLAARMNPDASSERTWSPRVLHQKTGTKPVSITDTPPTDTQQ